MKISSCCNQSNNNFRLLILISKLTMIFLIFQAFPSLIKATKTFNTNLNQFISIKCHLMHLINLSSHKCNTQIALNTNITKTKWSRLSNCRQHLWNFSNFVNLCYSIIRFNLFLSIWSTWHNNRLKKLFVFDHSECSVIIK